MEILLIFAFLLGILFASIGWGFVVLVLWRMYQTLEAENQKLRKRRLL